MTDPSMSRPIIHQRSPHSFVNTFGIPSFATETAAYRARFSASATAWNAGFGWR